MGALPLVLLGRPWSAGCGWSPRAASRRASWTLRLPSCRSLLPRGGGVDAAFRFVVVVAGAAWATVAAPVRAEAAGAGSPRDSASSRRRLLMTPSRDVIWRWSEAIIACSAVGGAGGGWAGRLPPLPPLERQRLRVAAPSSIAAGGTPARKGASAASRAVRTWGRCRRAASWVATPALSPIVRRARGR